MRHHQPDTPDDPQLSLPPALRDDLHALYGRSPAVPDMLDAEITRLARRRFVRRRRSRLVLRLAPVIGAAAAAVALFVRTAPPMRPAAESTHPADAPARSMVADRAQGRATASERTPALADATADGDRARTAMENAAGNRMPAAYDLDNSGRVDILDAFLLARRLHGGDAVPDTWDFNADGRVDEQDADVIAARAVRVEDRS